MRSLVFSTYQSSPIVTEAQSVGSIEEFDLVVADEAHRTASKLDSAFATVLQTEAIRARKRLFTTATPRNYSRKSKTADIVVASMDNEALFGPVLHRHTFAQAINEHHLSDYKVIAMEVSEAEVARLVSRGDILETSTGLAMEAGELVTHIALAKAMTAYGLRSVVTYHHTIARAEAFASSFPSVCAWLPPSQRPDGPLTATHVSGAMSSAERHARTSALERATEQHRVVVSNSRCLTEGIDVPTLDAVVFCDPKQSEIDITQAVGRILRKHEGKEVGVVLIPVVIHDMDGRSPDELVGDDWKTVGRVLLALRSHDDERLGRGLDASGRAQGHDSRAPDSEIEKFLAEHFEVASARLGCSAGSDADFAEWTQVDESFADALQLRAFGEAAGWFWGTLGRLEAWVEHQGRFPKQAVSEQVECDLADWAASRRQDYKKGRLSREQVEVLAAIPGWWWEDRRWTWDESCDALAQFVGTRGRLPSMSSPDDYERRLCKWGDKQRWSHKCRERLLPAQIEQLNEIPGFWRERQTPWATRRDALVGFVSAHGRLPGLRADDEEERRLGLWCRTQRSRRKKGKLGTDQIAMLEAVPNWYWQRLSAGWACATSSTNFAASSSCMSGLAPPLAEEMASPERRSAQARRREERELTR